MERYQVILAYDGSHYKGFQRQANARSVQATVEEALRKIGWRGATILAAGRTDTGAHATGQVIAFDLEWNHTSQELQKALNVNLPMDIVARQVKKVDPTFHPRYDACWRKYNYRIYCQAVRQPLLEPYAWRVWPSVELSVLNQEAQWLAGLHDFGAFGTPPQAGGSTQRVVLESGWHREDPYLVFEIIAQAFLYHMVRRIVHMQVSIAHGKLDLDYFRSALNSEFEGNGQAGVKQHRSDHLVHGLAPAQGLVLVEVHYPPEVLGIPEDNIKR